MTQCVHEYYLQAQPSHTSLNHTVNTLWEVVGGYKIPSSFLSKPSTSKST